MKLSFKQKNIIRVIGLLLILGGIIVFIYFELKKDRDMLSLNNIEKELSSKDKAQIRNNVNEAGGIKIQQYAAQGATANDGKITINEVAKIHELNNE